MLDDRKEACYQPATNLNLLKLHEIMYSIPIKL